MTHHAPLSGIPARRNRPVAAAFALAMATAAAAAEVTPFDYQKVGATLTYTIEITGQAHSSKANGSIWSKADVNRHLQGTLHLAGQRTTIASVDNAQAMIARTAPARQALAADMPTIQRIAEECGDDEACVTARMSRLVNGMSPDQRQALVSATKGPAAKLSQHVNGAWALDGNTACTIQATSRGASSYRSLAQGEGYAEYVTGAEDRHGQGSDDCRHDPVPEGRANWDGDRQQLDITLPGLSFAEQWQSAGGKRGTRTIAIPAVTLEHLHWSGKGPQSGQQVRQVTAQAGDGGVPATMTIRWTFTPDRA